MSVKIILACALLSLAAAYPMEAYSMEEEARMSTAYLECSDDINELYMGKHEYKMRLCEASFPSGASKECITGLPAHKCDMKRTSKCYTLLWYLGTWEWHTKICQFGFRKDYCYTNAVELESCDDVKEKATMEMVQVCTEKNGERQCSSALQNAVQQGNGIRICEKDKDGKEICSEEGRASVMEATCFCVKDGDKEVCTPKGCSPKERSAVMEATCFCVKDGDKEVCTPKGCSPKERSAVMEATCFCVKDGDKEVCTPKGCSPKERSANINNEFFFNNY